VHLRLRPTNDNQQQAKIIETMTEGFVDAFDIAPNHRVTLHLAERPDPLRGAWTLLLRMNCMARRVAFVATVNDLVTFVIPGTEALRFEFLSARMDVRVRDAYLAEYERIFPRHHFAVTLPAEALRGGDNVLDLRAYCLSPSGLFYPGVSLVALGPQGDGED